jgi:hypothetical protein
VCQRFDHLRDLRRHQYRHVFPFSQVFEHAAERENGRWVKPAGERLVQDQDRRFGYEHSADGYLLLLTVRVCANGSFALFGELE